jgi:glycyl-tRNA synthetase beta chain
MAKDLLLELGSEELPASFIVPALNDLENTLVNGLGELRLAHAGVKAYGSPRRLTVLLSGVAEKQEDFTEELMGPPAKVAYGPDGKLTKAGENFVKNNGLTEDQVTKKATPKGEYLAASRQVKGKTAHAVLPELLDKAIRAVNFKKSMRWGYETVTWARPMHWIVALFGEEVLPVTFGSVKSGRVTHGHRFLDPEPISIHSPAGYLKEMEKAHVWAEIDRRRHYVEQAAEGAAREVGGKILRDPALLDTVTNLVEWPCAVLGSFDKNYLDLPPEVLVSEMKSHQKYFSVVGADGKLMPHFVAISNTPVSDIKISRNGYERVLLARLADARFFFDEDQKVKLADLVEKLKKVVFQQQLGTSYEKMERFRALALDLAKWSGKGDPKVIERAAYLCKADLSTGMVGEFPELQGIMGREYARKQGEGEAVAVAIDEHYAPRNAADSLPQSDAGAMVGLADRLDSLVGLFGIGKKPTGAADQFGSRRGSLALLHIVLEKGYRFHLGQAVDRALELLGSKVAKPAETKKEVLDYLRERLKHEWSETRRADVVEAVLSAGFDDLVATLKRLDAISAIVGQPGFDPLATAFKRAVNIVVKQGGSVPEGQVDQALLSINEEQILYKAFLAVRVKVDALVQKDDYAGALAEITTLKPLVDAFFDKVRVMDASPADRDNRVRLLREMRTVFDRIADFSQIQVG